MFFKILINYILGYVNISVEGYFIERFINICISKNILLWNLKRKKSSFLYANVGLRDFRKLKQIAKKTKCRIKIETKKGIPFLLHKYKKRKIFLISLLVILIGIFGISNFLWNIEITGNETINTDEILQLLNDNDVKLGKLKQKIDTKQIISNIRLQRDDIAWIGMKIHGTNLLVEIVEADKKPDIINEQEYCNIISQKEGIITKINAANGTALVKQDDIVKKGDILIAGWLEGKYTGTRYVHAKGDIQAKVWYSKKEKMALKTHIEEQTGNEEKSYYIKINNFQINLLKRLPKFENYDTINENKKLKIFSNFYLPIEYGKNTYKEQTKKNITYSKEEAKNILIEKLEKELKEEIENTDNIVNTQMNFKENEDEIEVELIYEVLENIGTKEKLIF